MLSVISGPSREILTAFCPSFGRIQLLQSFFGGRGAGAAARATAETISKLREEMEKTGIFHGTNLDRFPYQIGDEFEVNSAGLYVGPRDVAGGYAENKLTSSRRKTDSIGGTPAIIQLEEKTTSNIGVFSMIKFSSFTPSSTWPYIPAGTRLIVKNILVQENGKWVPVKVKPEAATETAQKTKGFWERFKF